MKFTKFFSLILLCTLALTFTSCKKDLSDKIVGEWEVSSWISDGDELIGVDIDKAVFEFEEPEDNEGDVDLNVTVVGTNSTLSGTYEVDTDKNEIDFDFGSTKFTMEVDIDGDELDMEGTIDGSPVRIKAERD